MDRCQLAVLIPAYREGRTIGGIVAAALPYSQVIVVDDCSPDDTSCRAKEAGAIVVRNETNLGYDGTLNRAFETAVSAGFDCVVTMDADGEHDPALLGEFSRLLLDEGIPLVLGVRPRKQRFAEVVMGLYVRLRFGVSDILCGMKGYHLSLMLENNGFDHTNSIGTELAINSIRRGSTYRQIGVYGKPREGQPRFGRRLSANWRILAALWRVLRQDIAPRRAQVG